MSAIVLASTSPIRAKLLRDAGVEFVAVDPQVDEPALKARHSGVAPDRLAVMLAEAKALAPRRADIIAIGADQMLVCEGRAFDKPKSVPEAADHLRSLRGKEHRLATALACARDGAIVWSHLEQPRLAMRDFSDDFLDSYLARNGAVLLHSVGAYQLEGEGAQLFARVDGDHFAILGLPLLPLLDFLRRDGALLA